jgi:hypothetical protein
MSDPTLEAFDAEPKLFGFSLNRIVAFGGPYIAVASGAVADWLLVHVHFLSLFHTTRTTLAGAITQVVVFGVTATLTWLGHQKWLEGYQAWAYGKHSGTAGLPAGVDPSGPVNTQPSGDYDPNEFGKTIT